MLYWFYTMKADEQLMNERLSLNLSLKKQPWQHYSGTLANPIEFERKLAAEPINPSRIVIQSHPLTRP